MTFYNAQTEFAKWAYDTAGKLAEPIAEDIATTINGIKDIWELDCNGDLMLYVETFLPAAGQALLVLVTPQPTEILEEYLTPKNLRGTGRRGDRDSRRRKRGRKGHTKVFWGRGIPDTDGAIAGMLPGAATVQGRRVGLTGQLFWGGIQAADRFGWYSLIADVTADGVTNWMSNLMESRFCSKPAAIGFESTFDAGGDDIVSSLWFNSNEHDISTSLNFAVGADGRMSVNDPSGFNRTPTVSVAVGVDIHVLSSGVSCDGNWHLRLTTGPDGSGEILATGPPTHISVGSTGTVEVSEQITGHKVWYVSLFLDGSCHSGLRQKSGYVQAIGQWS